LAKSEVVNRPNLKNDLFVTFSSRLTAVPPSPPVSLGCISKTVLNNFVAAVVSEDISALGWRPYKTGLSGGRKSSMYWWYER